MTTKLTQLPTKNGQETPEIAPDAIPTATRVGILQLNDDNEMEEICQLVWQDDRWVIEGEQPDFLVTMLENGKYDPATDKMYTAVDPDFWYVLAKSQYTFMQVKRYE